jgi:hypothetical protein
MMVTWRLAVVALLFSNLVSVFCVVIPLRRVDNQTRSDGTNIPYTVPVQLFQNTVANMVIDMSTPLTFAFCCRSATIQKGQFCVNDGLCEAFSCPTNECSDRIHSFTQYKVNGKKSDVKVFRQKPYLNLDLVS